MEDEDFVVPQSTKVARAGRDTARATLLLLQAMLENQGDAIALATIQRARARAREIDEPEVARILATLLKA